MEMQKAQNGELVQENDEISRVYELGYLLVPTIKEEEIGAVYGNLKELVLSTSGDIISDEMPKVITLSYPMQKILSNVRKKFSAAYFGWIKFVMSPDKVLELKKRLDLDQNLIRFLILKTVKENTIAAKRFIRGDMEYRRPTMKKSAENETVVQRSSEEIDKEIDALIAN